MAIITYYLRRINSEILICFYYLLYLWLLFTILYGHSFYQNAMCFPLYMYIYTLLSMAIYHVLLSMAIILLKMCHPYLNHSCFPQTGRCTHLFCHCFDHGREGGLSQHGSNKPGLVTSNGITATIL